MMRVAIGIMIFAALLMASEASAISNEGWETTFGGTEFDEARTVQQTSDGGYIIAGRTISYGAGGNDGWLIKTNESGYEQWNRTFGGVELDYFNSVQQTSDGGYIIAGFTVSYGVEGSGVGSSRQMIWV